MPRAKSSVARYVDTDPASSSLDTVKASPPTKPTVKKYGLEMPRGVNVLEAELIAFRKGGDLGRAQHFKNVTAILWGEDNDVKRFVWHPLAEEMLDACLTYNWVALSGCASCGKTDFAAIWGVVNYLAAPLSTQVLALSTTIEQSRKRIWGAIQSYWMGAKHPLPGKVLGKTIRPWDGTTARLSDKVGITLFAAEKKKEREAAAQLIGIKADRVLMLADELPELSEAILEAAETNLDPGNPYFHFIGMGNHKSINDAFGKFSRPKSGWGSVTVQDTRWETDRGICLHMDALQHPNWLAQENLWPGPRVEKIQQAIDSPSMGPNSPGFWRMFRSFPCPAGEEQTLYSEADFIKFKAGDLPVWQAPVVPLAALDPAFTSGGDRSVAVFGLLGDDRNGNKTLAVTDVVEINEDVTDKTNPRNFQIAIKFRDLCVSRGILPRHAAIDGSNIPFSDIVSNEWSSEVLRVQFGGAASDLVVTAEGSTARERYANRVSELWGVGVSFLHNGQFRNLPPLLQAEMASRRYDTVKGEYLRTRVESKADMKMRTGKSPDVADAFFVLLDLARQRFGFAPFGGGSVRRGGTSEWLKLARHYDVAATGNRNVLTAAA